MTVEEIQKNIPADDNTSTSKTTRLLQEIQQDMDNAVKKNTVIKRIIKIAIVVILLFSLLGWCDSKQGRMTIARWYVSQGEYSKAYDKVCNVPGEDADAYEQYTSILKKVDYWCDHYEEASAYTTKTEIVDAIYGISSKTYLLKEEEAEVINKLKLYLDGYTESIMSDITYACKIYDRLAYYDTKSTWYAETEMETANSCEEALDRADSKCDELESESYSDYGNEIANYGYFYNSDNIREAIDKVQSNMQNNIDKGGEYIGSRYYTEPNFMETYPHPYKGDANVGGVDTFEEQRNKIEEAVAIKVREIVK